MTPTKPTPPMDPSSSEASERQLELARAQGATYVRALEHMAQEVADAGGTKSVGDYLVGYAVEEAEGMYRFSEGALEWQNPGDSNAHIEVAVCDRADGRFVPGLTVHVTLVSPSGHELGPHEQPLLWHPMLYHYGRNWELPEDGEYTLRIHVEPAPFMRHDEINGRRFVEAVEVEFTNVPVERSAAPVDPPV